MWATRDNTTEGDIVLIPLQGETGHDDWICEEYEVVLAFKKKHHPSDIVGEGQPQNPEWIEFRNDMALTL